MTPSGHANLQQAQDAEASRLYAEAVSAYRTYLQSDEASGAEKRHAQIKLPVLLEAISRGHSEALDIFLAAVNARAVHDPTEALRLIDDLQTRYPASYLADDAAYFQGYIALMDHFDFASAANGMRQVREQYPATPYYDTALYCEAIAQEQLGNPDQARELLQQLRKRHTSLSLDSLNLAWPQDDYLSRFWFERSDTRLDMLEQKSTSAAQIISRSTIDNPVYPQRLVLQHDGRELVLLLQDSSVFSATKLTHEQKSQLRENPIENLAGVVEAAEGSWVRISVKDDQVSGLISLDGKRIELTTASSTGSLSYFNKLLKSDDDGNPSTLQHDAPLPPAEESSFDAYIRNIRQNSTDHASAAAQTSNSVSKVARLGIVVDSQFNSYYNGQGLQQALSVLNTVDGVFRDELGLALQVDSATVFTQSSTDPMAIGRVPIEEMMINFSNYRKGENSTLSSDIGFATLFTGNKNSDRPLGLAWIGTACRTDGYDVSVVTPFYKGSLLSAHEIGHTLGALHDHETPCAETRYLMSRQLSDSTLSSFSDCSAHTIQTKISTASCHSDAVDLSLELVNIDADSVTLEVTNQNTTGTVNADVQIQFNNIGNASFPNTCKKTNVDKISCKVNSLAAADSHTLDIDFATIDDDNTQNTDSDSDEEPQLLAIVEPTGMIDIEKHNNAVLTDIYGNSTPYTLPSSLTPTIIGSAPAYESSASSGGGSIALWFCGLVVLYRRKDRYI